MARIKGSANFSGTIEPLAGGALDARDVVQAKADLTASGSFPYFYIGMETYVVAENKKYRLVGNDPTVLANWEEVGSGGGGGNINDETPTFTEASTRANIASGEKISVIMGKIQKFFTDLKTVAFSGSYSDLSNKPTIPDELADLTADSTHRVVTDTQIASWNGKQSPLTAGTGIDITNNVISATGGGGGSYSAGDGIDITNNVISVDEMASADMDEIITPLPSVGANLPILFDEQGEERVVGWYRYSNGTKKPVYEKTVIISSQSNDSKDYTLSSLGITNREKTISVFGILPNAGVPTGYYYSASNCLSVTAGSTNVNVYAPTQKANFPLNLTIQYTKTTDTAI